MNRIEQRIEWFSDDSFDTGPREPENDSSRMKMGCR